MPCKIIRSRGVFGRILSVVFGCETGVRLRGFYSPPPPPPPDGDDDDDDARYRSSGLNCYLLLMSFGFFSIISLASASALAIWSGVMSLAKVALLFLTASVLIFFAPFFRQCISMHRHGSDFPPHLLRHKNRHPQGCFAPWHFPARQLSGTTSALS